jgi:oligopeptide/dipeptide ABC transporter ATP-binding protein
MSSLNPPSLSDPPADRLLAVSDLKVMVSGTDGGRLALIDRANFSLGAHESLGIVGESGSGKSMLCRALIGTLGRYGAGVSGGSIMFEGRDLAAASERTWRTVRGRRVGYVPQSSMAGLNPVLTVGTQMLEAVGADTRLRRAEAKAAAVHYLELVQLPRAASLLRKRSHELSGGMRQRVMIAAALARNPVLLLADEPTTALDVSVQRDILSMLRELRAQLGMALILVSHDLAVIEDVCDRVLVMYAGATVEEAPVAEVARRPRHPYTLALLNSRIDGADRTQALPAIVGEPPMAGAWPVGCRFWPRCPMAQDDCRTGMQPPLMLVDNRVTACRHSDRMLSLDRV